MTLNDLAIGKSARILKVGGEGALRQHFLDMGLIPGAQITLVKYAPMGDPMELKIHGYEGPEPFRRGRGPFVEKPSIKRRSI